MEIGYCSKTIKSEGVGPMDLGKEKIMATIQINPTVFRKRYAFLAVLLYQIRSCHRTCMNQLFPF